MYKLLIADDEAIERFAFRTIITREFPEIDIISEASNGREAIQLSQELEPDIIVMDIRMPGINGIDAAKAIKAELRHAHIIVLTAYDNFEFIQEALKLGTDDYLLKPSKKDRIIQVIRKTIDSINEERKSQEQSRKINRKITEIKPLIENQMISSIVFGEINGLEAKRYVDFMDMDFSQGFVMVLSVGLSEKMTTQEYEELPAVCRKAYELIYNILHQKRDCAVSMPISNSIVVIFPEIKSLDEYRSRVYSVELATELRDMIAKALNKELYIGIGKHYENLDDMGRSYKEALKALKSSMPDDAVKHFGDMNQNMDLCTIFPSQKEKALFEAIRQGKNNDIDSLLEDIFSWIFLNMSTNITQIRNYLLSLLGMAIRIVIESGTISEYDKDFLNRDYLKGVNSITDIWNLKKWFEGAIKEIAASVLRFATSNISIIVKKAKDYIKENYMKELSLNDIAEIALLSPQYFSKIFKKETGMTFVDYVTEIRIEEAKEYLKSTLLNVKEISYKIGYNDPNYFFKVFKKLTDMTPKEYRSTHQHP